MTPREVHVDWLQLCEPDGPFFSLPVVLDAFPHGLDKVDPGDRAQVLERWSDCAEVEDRSEFVDWLLDEPLGWRDQLRRRDALDASWCYEAKDRGEVVRPDAVLVGHKDEPLVMVMVLPAGHDPRERNRGQRWTASPVQKASLLCRATGCPLALLSDGDLFTLVHAPEDGSTGIGTWRANLFSSEKEHLASFITLLRLGRFLAVKDNQTPSALLEASALN